MTEPKVTKKVEREASLRWVPIAKMRVNPLAQRDLNQSRVDHLAANLDLEQIGTPTVNNRDGAYYIIDGQHRIEALIQIGWEDQAIQCWTYSGLSEQDEAEKFLKLNDVLTVNSMAKFRAGVHAGRTVPCDIDRIVRAQNLCVSADKIDGAIGAVGTLERVYHRDGPAAMAKALRIIRDAYGSAGLEAAVIDGVALLCGRYGDAVSEEKAVKQLGGMRGGVKGLLNLTEDLRLRTGNPKAHCVAASAVDVINRGKGGPKLMSWWKTDEAA